MSKASPGGVNDRTALATPHRSRDLRLDAYLITRETLRRLKLSPDPYVARDWPPKPQAHGSAN